MLLRHNIIPLQHLPSAISQHISNRRRGHVRLPSEDFDEDPREWTDADRGRLSRDLEDGFGVYRDDVDDDDADAPAQQEEDEGLLAAVHPPAPMVKASPAPATEPVTLL